MAKWVKDLALSLQGLRSPAGPGTSACHRHGKKKKKKNGTFRWRIKGPGAPTSLDSFGVRS